MRSFSESTLVLGMPNASFFATDLFFEGFGTAFPLPRGADATAVSASTSGHWRQFVAFYKWSDACIEPVAFANFIHRGEVYLLGGLCARRNFYRRLPAAHWRECRERGGIVQMLLESAARELGDAIAIFGYCGDRKSWLVSARAGYLRTDHRYLIVKWLRDVSEARKRDLQESVASIGPF